MKYILTAFLLLAFCSSLFAQNTYLSEDFTNGVPPAGWANTAAPGTQGWVSTGSRAWHEDEANVTCDSYLISPDIDLSTATDAYLHLAGETGFASYLANHPNSSGDGVSTIEVTTDGGASWTVIWTDTTIADNTTYAETGVMTAFVGSANVNISMHYYGTWAHEWWVDSLIINDTPDLSGKLHQWDGQNVGDEFGYSVSTAGDVNGDSIPDVIVGTGGLPGSAYVYSGANGALLHQWAGQNYLYFGSSVSTAGDVNGDGVPDVIVGAPSGSISAYTGSAYVYSGVNGALLYQWNGQNAGDEFGYSVSTAGDVNGDSIPDVIVGAKNAANTKGSAYVYSGANGSLLHQWDGRTANSYFGHSVSTAGDVNGDSISDVIVGAFGADSVYVYSGANGALLYQWDGQNAGDEFGYSVSTAGDLNGDGAPDVIVGASRGFYGSGSVYVYSGANGSLLHQWYGQSSYSFFGNSVSTAGDVNGDGVPDVIVGAPSWYSWINDNGSAYVYSGANGSLLHQWDGQNADDQFGYSVSTAGDINGDGTDDVIASAPGFYGSGSVYVYSGALVNNPPNAFNDNASTLYGLPVTIDVLSNDNDPDGDTLTVISTDIPAHGSAIITGNQVVYTPDAGWLGTDSFLYFIEDPDGDTANATITVEVTGPSYAISNFVAGNYALFQISGAPPNSSVTIGYSLTGAGPTTTAFGIVDMSAPIKSLVSLPADSSGNAWFSPLVPAGTAGITFYTQAKCGNILSNSLALTVQ